MCNEWATLNPQRTLHVSGFLIASLVIFLSLPIPEIIEYCRNRENISELRTLFPVDYNIDKAKYYYAIIAHSYFMSMVVVFLIASMDSLFIVLIQHACILFAITGYVFITLLVNGE